ncbi:MAG: NAD-dependent succinate-semialdehyde dehydrogenase, partial [Verrucomicrobia bacterium 21-51-4]
TILSHVHADMLICQEETFGPVVALISFDTDAEVIAKANATPYGLAGYIFTQDITRAHRLSEALECGIIGLNTGAVSMPEVPFGGMKQSGFGREGGQEGLAAYLETKYVCLGGI